VGIAMLFACGFLLGGAYSLAKQRRKVGAAVVGLAAVVAGVAAALWLVGGR
jgi:hypothetical protein